MIKEPTSKGALLDRIFTNWEELFVDVKVRGSVGCSDHETLAFSTLRGKIKAKTGNTAMHFRRADFGLFGNLLCKIPWNTAQERRRPQETLLMFKDHLLQDQASTIPTSRKSKAAGDWHG